MGNVLVVSTVDHPEEVLRRHLGGTDKLKVVVPVVRQGVLDWLANDQKAFSHAEHIAEDVAAHLPGETVEAKAGEADVGLAIRDALATFPADEIVIAVRPTDQEGKVESAATVQRADGESSRYPCSLRSDPRIVAGRQAWFDSPEPPFGSESVVLRPGPDPTNAFAGVVVAVDASLFRVRARGRARRVT